MKDLLFTEEDFATQDGLELVLDPNAKEDEFNDSFMCTLRVARILEAHCNRILQEKLEKAPEVRTSSPGRNAEWLHAERELYATHTARLVCIEGIEK